MLTLAVSVTQGLVVHAVALAQTTTPAWVQVSVATVWHLPSSPRPVDTPALGNPAGIEDWLTRLSVTERLGLDSRINTQVLLGQEVLVLSHPGGDGARSRSPIDTAHASPTASSAGCRMFSCPPSHHRQTLGK